MKKMDDPDRLLDSFEAAEFLGITHELLFSYVQHAPKTSLKHTRRLIAIQNSGQSMFRQSDLEEFDAYLKEPWSTNGQDRPPIPKYIIQHLKTESGGQCPRCGRGFKLESAHIEDYAHSLSHHHHNLIQLCALCHKEFDTKKILPANEIVALKETLITQTRMRLRQRFAAWPMSGLAPPTPAPIFFGREVELKTVMEGLAQRRTVCIRGPGGIGKTQLALNALAQLSGEARAVWVDVETFKTVAELELSLRSALVSVDGRPITPSLPEVLEAEVDLLVFDGVEAIATARLEELEDFFSRLITRTRSTKFLFTSQAELLSVDMDLSVELSSLDEAASLRVLQALAGQPLLTSNDDAEAIAWLLDFSGGHALTLKIMGGLLRYFKSARVVADRIKKSGTSALSIPNRRQHTKATSLEMCLTVAYTALQQEERRALFVVSHCPAGCLAAMFDRTGNYGVMDGQAAIAALGRWHLLYQDLDVWPGPRVRALSPIRAFVQHAFQAEDISRADAILLELATNLAIQAAVLDDKYIYAGNIAHGIFRLNQEFPNLSHIIDESVRRSAAESAYLKLIWHLASSLQVFCFISGLFRRGIEIMRAGAVAAVQSGEPRVASRLLLHRVALARRAGDRDEGRRAVQEIRDLAQAVADSVLAGHAAMATGMVAQDEDRLDEAERCFVVAYNHFENTGTADMVDAAESSGRTQGGHEHMLAMTLMEQGRIYENTGRPADALEIYDRALSLVVKTGDEVNYGSVMHHIANCHSALNQNEAAYRAYVEATTRFAEIGASGYLSNSLSELGYLLIDYEPGVGIISALSSELLEAGLVDAMQECADAFQPDLDVLPPQKGIFVIRKLFGVAALVSFTPHNSLLHDCDNILRERLVLPLSDQLGRGERHNTMVRMLLMYLDVMAELIGSLSGPDQTAGSGVVATIPEIEHFARLCYRQYDYAWEAFRLFDWLAAYLSRCRGVPGITAAILQAAAERAAESGQPFSLSGLASA